MKKLFEILLVAVIFFSLGMYVGQDKDTADTPVVITDTPIVDTDTTTAVKVPELKPKSKLKPAVVKSKNLAVIYTFDEDIETEYNEFTETKVQTIGFALTDPHKRVNDHYKEKYGSTKLDFLSFQSIVNDEKIKSLLNIDPRIAAFSPFNLLGYKKLNEKQTYVMHLMPEVILDIIGIDDEKLRAAYIESFVELDALIEKELGGTKSYIKYDKFAEKRMMNFELTFDRPKDLTDFVDDFQEKFEETFEEGGYLIAGYYNFKENGEDTIPEYDAFWTYALCHFKFSYTVFDNEGGRPKAGIFAPCAMYMYVKKDTSTLVIGMPTLANWGATLKIDDPKRAEFMKKLDKDIPALLESLGAKAVANVNPLTRKSTTSNAVAKTASTAVKTVEEKKPEAVATPRVVTTPSTAGHIEKEIISAYLRGSFASVAQVEADLKNAGFEVLGTHDIDKKGDLTTITFTCPSLKKMANKKNRGTGVKAQYPGLEVGGKTGTAHIAKNGRYVREYHSSFYGFANDKEGNKYTIGVLVIRAKKRYKYFASLSAVPTFKRIVHTLVELDYLHPEGNVTEELKPIITKSAKPELATVATTIKKIDPKNKPMKKKRAKKKADKTKITVKPQKASVKELFNIEKKPKENSKPKPAKDRSAHELFEDLF